MRFMLKVGIQTESGNRAIHEGTIQKTFQAFVEQNKPEAMYFYPDNGSRAFLAILDIQDPSQIPVITEPLYTTFNASIDIIPVMTANDVMNGTRVVLEKFK